MNFFKILTAALSPSVVYECDLRAHALDLQPAHGGNLLTLWYTV